MPAKRINALIAVSLIGAAISIYQSAMFYKIREGTAGFTSVCNLGEHANCDLVMASKYAELGMGIPLSSAAAGWFLGLFIVGLFARNAFWRRDALRVALGMSGFSAAMGLLYFGIMMGVLHTFCLFCLLVDLCTLGSLGLVLSLKSEWSSQVKPDFSKLKALVGTALGALVLGAGMLKTLDQHGRLPGDIDRKLDDLMASQVLAVGAGPEFPSLGPKDAPITIVEFSDFQCPHCRLGATTMNAVLNRFPKDVRLVFRGYPLDPSCNSSVQHQLHPVACEATRVALCAAKQGKFKQVYEALFEHQEKLSTVGDGQPSELAAAAGADKAALPACTSSPEIAMAVAKDVDEGNRLGINATPTFFVNGHKIEGGLTVPVWNRLIERILAGKK